MGANRCTDCAIGWPDDDAYAYCPQCEGFTWWSTSSTPIPDEEARRLTAHADFERYEGRETPAMVQARDAKYAGQNREQLERFEVKAAQLRDTRRRFREVVAVLDTESLPSPDAQDATHRPTRNGGRPQGGSSQGRGPRPRIERGSGQA